jgi:UDP-N-acetyl-D-galactosamine dehydrogenase
MHEHGVDLHRQAGRRYDLVVVAVPHQAYAALSDARIAGLLTPGGLLADLKNLFGDRQLGAIDRWSL